MKRMYQIMKSTTNWPEESIGRLLVLLAMLLGGLAGAAIALLIPGLSSQTLNLCALGVLLSGIWSMITLLNLHI